MWVLPFCGGFILFSPDLVHFVLGAKWRPAVPLLQGLAGAAAVQQLGYNWFSFYRARGDSSRQAVEAAVTAATFLGLAVPGSVDLGRLGLHRRAAGQRRCVLAVRRHYVQKLLGVELVWLGSAGRRRSPAAAAVVLALRAAVWTGPRSLAAGRGRDRGLPGLSAGLTWATERVLVVDLLAQLRAAARCATLGDEHVVVIEPLEQRGSGRPPSGPRCARRWSARASWARALTTSDRSSARSPVGAPGSGWPRSGAGRLRR